MNAPSPSLSTRQRRFAGYIRNPEQAAVPPDVPASRMAVYRELFFNNIASLLEESFPATRGCVPDERWQELVRRFFAGHRARTPFFSRLPGEFSAWLNATPRDAGDPPYLAELAHFEWSRLAVSIAPDGPGSTGDPLSGLPRFGASTRLLAYRWPVHRLFAGEPVGAAEATRLCLWRDRDERVRMLLLNPATARLLERVAANRTESGRRLLARMAAELARPDDAAVIAGGQAILDTLHEGGALVCTPRENADDTPA